MCEPIFEIFAEKNLFRKEIVMFGKIKTAEEALKLIEMLANEEKTKLFAELAKEDNEVTEDNGEKTEEVEETEELEETKEEVTEEVEEKTEPEKVEETEEAEEADETEAEAEEDKKDEVIEALTARLATTEETLAKMQEQIDAMAEAYDHRPVGKKPAAPMEENDKDTMSPIERGYFAKANYRK